MSEQKTTKTGNVLGVTRLQTADGSAKAVMSTRRIKINTNPKVRESKSKKGYFLSFLFGVYGESSIKKVKFGLNNPTALVEDPKFGVSIGTTVFARSEAQKDYLVSVLKKGAYVDGLHGTIHMDPTYGVQYFVDASELGYIHSDNDDETDKSEDVPPVETDAADDSSDNFVV